MNISNWEDVRDYIHECLLSSQWHKTELKFCVKLPAAADVYKVFLIDGGNGQRAYVTEALIKYWGKTLTDIDLAAKHNDAGYNVTPITDFLGSTHAIDAPDPGLYICTNSRGSFGAAAILNEDIQRQLSSICPEGYYVLPSSIHEVVAASVGPSSVESLSRMVQEINRSCVNESERLSDHVFVIKDGQLTVAL